MTARSGSPDVEHFRRWVMAAVSTPSLRRQLHARRALYRPEDLPAMIAVLREAELVCLSGLMELGRRGREERPRVAVRRDGRHTSVSANAEGVERLYTKITWLQNVRIDLEKQRRRGVSGGRVSPTGRRADCASGSP